MIVAVTGGSAGVGRATAREFSARGWDVAIIARDEARLEASAAEVRRHGVKVLAVAADVADFAALDAAAARIEGELGPIDVWVNNAMATVFAPVRCITPEEFRRGTEVTYLGQVHGTMAALRRMRARNRGVIVNVGSALAYRAIPLQSVYCGAKYAVRGFTDALRVELMHERSAVRVVMVHRPAINTPQFDWALNKTGRRPQPVPPIYQPELAARAIVFAATHPHRREIRLGLPTVLTIAANKLAPGLLDRYLAKSGYSGQLTADPAPEDAPANLYTPVAGKFGAHGRFDARAKKRAWDVPATLHPGLTLLALGAFVALGLSAERFLRRSR